MYYKVEIHDTEFRNKLLAQNNSIEELESELETTKRNLKQFNETSSFEIISNKNEQMKFIS